MRVFQHAILVTSALSCQAARPARHLVNGTREAVLARLSLAVKTLSLYSGEPADNYSTVNTDVWITSVLGSNFVRWESQASQRRSASVEEERRGHLFPGCVDSSSQGMSHEPCVHRQRACQEAQRYLTSASCVLAGGYKGEHHQVCHFRNLYSSGSAAKHSLVAHIIKTADINFPTDRVCNVRSIGSEKDILVNVKEHTSLEAFADFLQDVGDIAVLENLTLAWKPFWQNNIGHALYDTLYPAFVSLLQLGRSEEPYRTLLMQAPPDPNYYAQERLANEDIFAVIGRGSKVSTYELNRLYRFVEVIVGVGPNSAEYDINFNITLGCARSLGAAGAFRDRIYRSFGLPVPAKRMVSNEGRTGKDRLQGILVDNPGHMVTGSFAQDAASLASLVGINLKPIYWYDAELFPTKSDHRFYSAPGPERFRQHLQLLSNTDIHISGPGTTMMYQQLLPDGSVVVNLGDFASGNTMDEYMTEGAAYLRAVYAFPHPGVTPTAEHVASLAKMAREVIMAGFPTSGVEGSNLSPTAAVLKAYAHLTSMGGLPKMVDPLKVLRKLEVFNCNPGVFDTMRTVMELRAPCDNSTDIRLLQELRRDFQSWDRFGPGHGWFDRVRAE